MGRNWGLLHISQLHLKNHLRMKKHGTCIYRTYVMNKHTCIVLYVHWCDSSSPNSSGELGTIFNKRKLRQVGLVSCKWIFTGYFLKCWVNGWQEKSQDSSLWYLSLFLFLALLRHILWRLVNLYTLLVRVKRGKKSMIKAREDGALH